MKDIDWAKVVKRIEQGVFAIRWMLIPLYVGLVAALTLYIVHFCHEVLEMVLNMGENASKQDILMLFILELVDMTMISQLVIMTIQGGYAIFIRPFDYDNLSSRPQWLKHGLGTSEQKIKLGMSICGIMMVQLLKNFIAIHGGTHSDGIGDAALTQEQLWMRLEMLGGVSMVTLMFCLYNILMHLPMFNHDDDDNHTPESIKDQH